MASFPRTIPMAPPAGEMMDARRAWHDTWFDVDGTSEPRFFLRFLDMTRAPLLNALRAHPEGFRKSHGLEPGSRVLDLGCGVGHFTRWFAELVGPEGRVTGLDNSRVMLEEARRRSEGSPLPLEYVQGDAHRLPFADETFDVSYAHLVLEHLEEPRRALAELVRVTRPGGTVIVIDNDFEDPELKQTLTPVAQRLAEVLSRVFNSQLARQLPELFAQAGLEAVRVDEVRNAFQRMNPVLKDLVQGTVDHAVAEGAVTPAEGEAHLAHLLEQDARGQFHIAWHTLAVTGRKRG